MIFLAALYLTAAQLNSLNYTLQEGSRYGEGYTLAAIEWEESSFCRNKGTSWSRGCLGIKRKTARIFDSGVTRLQLTNDDARNVRDGLLFLLYCRDHTKDWRSMVYCYHYGLPKASHATKTEIDSDGYVKAVSMKVRELEAIHETED